MTGHDARQHHAATSRASAPAEFSRRLGINSSVKCFFHRTKGQWSVFFCTAACTTTPCTTALHHALHHHQAPRPAPPTSRYRISPIESLLTVPPFLVLIIFTSTHPLQSARTPRKYRAQGLTKSACPRMVYAQPVPLVSLHPCIYVVLTHLASMSHSFLARHQQPTR